MALRDGSYDPTPVVQPTPSHSNQFNTTPSPAVVTPLEPKFPIHAPQHPITDALIVADSSFSSLQKPKEFRVERKVFVTKCEAKLKLFQDCWSANRTTRELYRCTCSKEGPACLDLPQVNVIDNNNTVKLNTTPQTTRQTTQRTTTTNNMHAQHTSSIRLIYVTFNCILNNNHLIF
jgi:hypothetical protein